MLIPEFRSLEQGSLSLIGRLTSFAVHREIQLLSKVIVQLSQQQCTMFRCMFPNYRWVQSLKPPAVCARWKRGFNSSASACKKKMPDRPAFLPEDEFTEAFLCGSGPGGQKIVGSVH